MKQHPQQIFEKLVNKNAIKPQIGDPLQISPKSPPPPGILTKI
jgi:DNA polymerase II small subunit/DNA polymerase delta subunit B